MTIARNLDPRTGSNYGSGCWFFNEFGEIVIWGKSFHDGTLMSLSFPVGEVDTTPAFKAWFYYNRDFGPDDIKRIKRANDLNSRCRGERGDHPATTIICEERDQVVSELEASGICWGPNDAPGFEKRWMRC